MARVLLLFVLIGRVYAASPYVKHGLRRCAQLPIIGSMERGQSARVYEKVASYLRRSDWCSYRAISPALTMLQSYRTNLDFHLENPEILRKIAGKTKSGALIRTKAYRMGRGLDLAMEVVGENGIDIFFSEKRRLEKGEAGEVARVFVDWLEIYKKTIPYDGRIVEVFDGRWRINRGSRAKIVEGQRFKVLRPIDKVNHPLLDKTIEWKTESVSEGAVVEARPFHSWGREREPGKAAVRPGDWVVFERGVKPGLQEEGARAKDRRPQGGVDMMTGGEGKEGFESALGRLFLGTGLGRGSWSVGEKGKRAGGTVGAYLRGELWVTDSTLLVARWERSRGAYERQTGEEGFFETEIMRSVVKIMGGWRFWPRTPVKDSRLDLLGGYVSHGYDLEGNTEKKGFGPRQSEGWLVGLRAEVPFSERWRVFMGWEFPPFKGIDGGGIGGRGQFEVGGRYLLSSRMAIEGSLEVVSHRVGAGKEGAFFSERVLKGGVMLPY